jgi:hypothetical protein
MILQISASQLARITGMNHQRQAWLQRLFFFLVFWAILGFGLHTVRQVLYHLSHFANYKYYSYLLLLADAKADLL